MSEPCGCIRGKYNAYAEAIDKTNIIYQDFSDWMEDGGYVRPDTYDVTITLPAETEGITLPLNTAGITRITEEDVGQIKDGVWTFETTSCGIKYSRYMGIFFTIECCLTKAFATEPSRKYDDLKEVELYLELTKAAISIGNIEEAENTLEVAQDKLDRLNCNCC